jgi:hypothetical protein
MEYVRDLIFCVIIIIVAGSFAVNPMIFNYFSIRRIDLNSLNQRALIIVRAMAAILALYAIICVFSQLIFGNDIFL